MPRLGFEPTSGDLHWPGSFWRTLCRMSYSATAKNFAYKIGPNFSFKCCCKFFWSRLGGRRTFLVSNAARSELPKVKKNPTHFVRRSFSKVHSLISSFIHSSAITDAHLISTAFICASHEKWFIHLRSWVNKSGARIVGVFYFKARFSIRQSDYFFKFDKKIE